MLSLIAPIRGIGLIAHFLSIGIAIWLLIYSPAFKAHMLARPAVIVVVSAT
jgi:hypothetical protein